MCRWTGTPRWRISTALPRSFPIPCHPRPGLSRLTGSGPTGSRWAGGSGGTTLAGMSGLARPPFVGRTEELSLLREGLVSATGSRPGCIAVTGDAGVGKTRLLAEFAVLARAEGARVVVGAGIDLAADEFPFGVFLSAFRDLARWQRRDPQRDQSGTPYDEVLALLHTHTSVVAGAERTDRSQLFDRVLDLLGELSDELPLVLILEDLHWADRTSLDLLKFLVQDLCQERDLLRDLPRERILLVLSWRSDEVVDGSFRWDALADLERLRCIEVVRLGALDQAELSTMLRAVTSAPLTTAQTEEIARRSAGNPLFAQELLAAGPRSAGRSAPVSCREVVLRRARRLSSAAGVAVRALAVIGRPADHALLAEVSELPPDELAAGLREGLDQRLLRREGDGELYAFRHPLGQEAVYDDILPGERLVLHGRTAGALDRLTAATESSGFVGAELAHHWHKAQVWARALPAAVAAARAAAGVTGFAEAYAQYQQALDAWAHLPDGATLDCTLAELQEEAAEAAHWVGATAEAVALATAAREAARSRGDVHAEARVNERLGRYLWELGDPVAGLAADRDAVRLLAGEPPSRLQARARAALAAGLLLDGESAAAAEEATAAVALARTADSPAEESYALTTLGVCRAINGELDQALDLLDQARVISEDCGSIEEVFRVYADLTFVLTTAGRPQESLEVAYAGMARTRQLGLTSTGGGALLVNTASTLQVLGDWDEARRVAHDALQQGVHDSFAGYLHLLIGDVAAARGSADEAEQSYAAAERITPLLADAWFGATLAASRAELQLWTGAPQDALRLVSETLPSLAKADYDEPAARLCALARRALADSAERERLLPSGRAPDLALADVVADRERQCGASQVRTSAPAIDAFLLQGAAEVARGAVRPDPDAWGEVAARWRGLGQPYAAGYALWREAEALVATKARRKAGAILADAAAVAEKLRAAPLQREIAALAQRATLPVDIPAQRTAPTTTSQRLGLTPREEQVLPLVASGRTNRQIARALFITEKTVSVHVSNIMAKLGAANRGEAAAAAFTLDLVPTPSLPTRPG